MEIEINYDGTSVVCNPGETVLESLERSGISVPSSCRAGVCQFCMLRAVGGSVPEQAKQGIKPALRDSGHFLACVCRPVEPIACVPAHTADYRGWVEISEICPLSPEVVRVRFVRPDGFRPVGGQFVTFRLDDGHHRSYSIASPSAADGYFDIHVRRIKDGRMSGWFHDHAYPRDQIWMEGPRGDCIYYPGMPEEPLTFVGTGTGIAPLIAIVADALAHGHTGAITIYQGAVSEEQLYYTGEIRALTAGRLNVRYIRAVMQQPCSAEVAHGDLKVLAAAELTQAAAQRIYLCGDPGLVRVLKKKFFLAGVSLSRMHADPFVVTASSRP